MSDIKNCFKCLETKPLSEFYKHSEMADGHLNKCKECTKIDVKDRYERDYEKVQAYEKKRSKQPHRKLAVKIYQTKNREICNAAKGRYIERNPKKRAVHAIVGNALRARIIIKQPCVVCGEKHNVHAHHCDYNKPLDVMWLCPQHHKDWHNLNEAING